ncbi:MAG: hypothetical protein ACK5WN_15495 [Alphaproteobacteria bacterium]|nr:hypothetical protein [Roseomonas sp.]
MAARRQGTRQDNQLALGAANGQGANDQKDPHLLFNSALAQRSLATPRI